MQCKRILAALRLDGTRSMPVARANPRCCSGNRVHSLWNPTRETVALPVLGCSTRRGAGQESGDDAGRVADDQTPRSAETRLAAAVTCREVGV